MAFSPLSIGSLSVTSTAMASYWGRYNAFQSPFYRVFECNLTILIIMTITFSPLSIGSLSVTILVARGTTTSAIGFQSPFYRVFECNNVWIKGKQEEKVIAFSPLSIGSLSVTLNPGRFDKEALDFQSPFYRVFECN